MKSISVFFHCVAVGLVMALKAPAQGTITFDAHPYFGGTNYIELGMQLRVINPVNNYGMGALLGGGNSPYNGTPYMSYIQQGGSDYIALNLTNGSSFGLASVWLADLAAPSLSPVPISFVGLLSNGSSVTNIFTTPGGGATTFQSYLFSSDFASGLTSVDILAPRWAMDNLVFGNVAPVPEPGTACLLVVGGLLVAWRWRQAIRRGNGAAD